MNRKKNKIINYFIKRKKSHRLQKIANSDKELNQAKFKMRRFESVKFCGRRSYRGRGETSAEGRREGKFAFLRRKTDRRKNIFCQIRKKRVLKGDPESTQIRGRKIKRGMGLDECKRGLSRLHARGGYGVPFRALPTGRGTETARGTRRLTAPRRTEQPRSTTEAAERHPTTRHQETTQHTFSKYAPPRLLSQSAEREDPAAMMPAAIDNGALMKMPPSSKISLPNFI